MSTEGTVLVTILTPERKLADRIAVSELSLTTSEGVAQILPGHTAFVGTLGTGPFSYLSGHGGELQEGVISSGFYEVIPHADRTEVHVVAETLELKSEIDADRARQAQQKAEQVLRESELDDHTFNKYQLKLQRAMIRQQVVGNA